MSKGAFGKARKRIPIYKQHGYSSMAEHDWKRWGTLNNYFNQKGHPKQKRAEEAIEWGRKFDGYDPEKEQKELREKCQKIFDNCKEQLKKEEDGN